MKPLHCAALIPRLSPVRKYILYSLIMIYGYIRVSTAAQQTENQRYEIEQFCLRERIVVHDWIEECISGTKGYQERDLGRLLGQVQSGDIIICTELSRLGRNLFMIMELLALCMKRGCGVWTIKDNYRLGDDIASKVLAFAFGLSAEIERTLISQRTKEALARRKQEGKVLGRPRGSKSQSTKLTGQEDFIVSQLRAECSKASIASRLGVSLPTLRRFIQVHQLAKRANPEN